MSWAWVLLDEGEPCLRAFPNSQKEGKLNTDDSKSLQDTLIFFKDVLLARKMPSVASRKTPSH